MNTFLRQIIVIALAAMEILPLSAQQTVPVGNKTARYEIHRTPTTKTIVVDGGVTRLEPFKEGLACVAHKKGYFVINRQGEKVFDLPKGYWPKGTEEGTHGKFNVGFNSGRLMVFSKEAKHAIIYDTHGQVVKEFRGALDASGFQDGVAVIKKRERKQGSYMEETVWYHIDINGNVLSTKVPASGFSSTNFRIFPLNNGLSPVYDEKSSAWGYRNQKCQIIIPIKYGGFGASVGGGFHNGLSRALDKESKKWGYLDTNGNWAIPPIYTERPGNFTGRYAKVVDKAGTQYMINLKGEIAFTEPNPGKHDKIDDFWPNGYSVWFLDKKFYIVNTSFQKVAQCDLNYLGECIASGDDWFLWGCGVCAEGYKLFDLHGNLLLDYGSHAIFSEKLCGHGNYYFNDKGEVIVIFEDTKF